MYSSPEAEPALAVLAKEPAHLATTYLVTNSGCFAESLPYVTETNRLLPNETRVANAIRALLDHQDVVRAVDVGGMLGYSFVRIASEFPQEVAADRLQMIVTNVEPDFTIAAGIAEAKRRITIQDHWKEIIQLLTQTPGNIELLHSLNSKGKGSLLPRREDIEFLENNHQLVTYISSVDTMQLPQALAMRYPPHGTIDIIHEKFGGFYHHPDHHNVLSSVAQIINRQTGTIMTTTPIDSILFLEGFDRLVDMGLHYVGQAAGGYWLYGMPKSPMASTMSTA